MATRSKIGVRQSDGTITSIYCHWDGYPSNQMPILLGSYNTIEKANELMELGSLSSLGPRLAPNPDEQHSFDKPVDGICAAYHRDRGEELSISRREHIFEFLQSGSGEEYHYLFRDGKWEVGPKPFYDAVPEQIIEKLPAPDAK